MNYFSLLPWIMRHRNHPAKDCHMSLRGMRPSQAPIPVTQYKALARSNGWLKFVC